VPRCAILFDAGLLDQRPPSGCQGGTVVLGINGLLYVPLYITQEQHDFLVKTIDEQPWRSDIARRTQHYGYVYEYRAATADLSAPVGELPAWLRGVAAQMERDGIAPYRFDQAIVNEYEPGQGIGKHVDAPALWADTVASLSLGAPTVMELARGEERVSIFLEPRSVIVFRGEARYEWRHGVARRKTDVVDGITIPRGRRISVTFRKARGPHPQRVHELEESS
jgi:alkylated DNA repair dioxygenase AlkB